MIKMFPTGENWKNLREYAPKESRAAWRHTNLPNAQRIAGNLQRFFYIDFKLSESRKTKCLKNNMTKMCCS